MVDGLVAGMLILSWCLAVVLLLAAMDAAWRGGRRLLDRLEAWARRRRSR